MYYYQQPDDDTGIKVLIVLAGIAAILIYYFRRRPALTSHGTAEWASDKLLRAWGMLGKQGLILARTLSGALIRMPRYCHVLLIGGTGSGKGVGIIIPNLLDYVRGSMIVFDTKGDLYQTTAGWRHSRKRQRIVRLDPFGRNDHTWNPLDTIPDGPLLIDSARAMADALVVREGTEPDPYWNDKAVQVITAILVLVLRRFTGPERSLNSVQDIASDPAVLASAAHELHKMGGIPARLGLQVKILFDKEGLPTKEGTGVLSTVNRHMSFLDSEMVAKSVATSSIDVRDVMKPGTTLYLTIPPKHLEAQKGLLRCWVSTLIRVIGDTGCETHGEVLMLLDEASALGGLAGVEEALVRGRSAGVRMLLAYQSDTQVRTAFRDKPTLIHDNCGTVIHMGPPGNYQDAETLSKSLGDWTQVVEGEGDNWSRSPSAGAGNPGQVSWGGSRNREEKGRALMRPEELMTMGDDYLIAFLRGFPAPILGRRIKWYEDTAFGSSGGLRISPDTRFWLIFLVIWTVIGVIPLTFLIVRAKVNGYGYWAQETIPAAAPVAENVPAKRGYLGLGFRTFKEEDAAEMGMKEAAGVLITKVLADSPASAAGVQPGDVLLEIDGKPVRTQEELLSLISGTPPGKRIQLQLWREGQMTCAEAEVGDLSKLQSSLNSKP
jgi:type IV secretion system protein VirD4